jgi:hypothetical protein
MILLLQEKLEIEAIRKSNVIRVSYRSKDPALATRVVGTLTDSYLSRRAKMYQSPQTLSFFEEQAKEAGSLLAQRESALETFLASSGITMVEGPEGSDALATQKNLVMQRLGRTQDELGAAEVELRECRTGFRTPQRSPQSRSGWSLESLQPGAREESKGHCASSSSDRLLQDFKPDSRYVRTSTPRSRWRAAVRALGRGGEH